MSHKKDKCCKCYCMSEPNCYCNNSRNNCCNNPYNNCFNPCCCNQNMLNCLTENPIYLVLLLLILFGTTR